jgi:hypothetical protein
LCTNVAFYGTIEARISFAALFPPILAAHFEGRLFMVMIVRLTQLTPVLAVCVALAGCGSSRFTSSASSGPPLPPMSDRGVVYNNPGSAPLTPAEAVFQSRAQSPQLAPVVASPLPPPSGGLQGGPGGFTGDDSGQLLAARATPPQAPQQVAARATPTSPQTLEPAATPVAPSSTRSSAIGGWNMRDGTGASCRVQLSSSPALDLYKATAAGCANKDLSRVTAWDHRDGEVYLYQPGGTVVARLRQEGSSYSGVMTKSGATLDMSR